MNSRTMGAVQGAVSGGKVGGPWGAVIGGVLGAARAGHAGQSLAEQIGRNNDGTLKTPAQQMLTPQEQLWGGNEGDGTDMLSLTPEDEANIAQGIDNGFGEL